MNKSSHSNNLDLQNFMNLIYFAEGLKKELRHSYLSCGRTESVAEHSWRLALMVMSISDKLNSDFDAYKAIKLALIHDISEIIASDIPLFQTEGNKDAEKFKFESELKAIEKISELAGDSLGLEIKDLWLEHENQSSYEAKVVRALDKLEAQIQHNQADISTWTKWEKDRLYSGKLEEVCSFDECLKNLCSIVVLDGKEKLKTSKN